MTEGLGWLSIGLGLAQIFAPRAVCRLVGVPVAPTFMRLCGLRELACGIGILTQEQPTPWVQARVAGDAMDLASLAASAVMRSAEGRRVAVAMGAVAGITALDVYCSRELAEAETKTPRHVQATIAVNRPPEELYRFWRELQNLPRVMPHLESVQPLGDECFHWVAKGPAGTRVEWDSEIIDDRPNERLAWRSLEGSDVYNAGSVRFDPAPAGRGTYVTVELLYEPPAGTLGVAMAKLFGRDAGQEVRADLRAFKMLMETGEIATTEGQPRGPELYGPLSRTAR
jgi:uncharacterized membrane protein